MAVKERSQIKGTNAQIKAFAGHNGVLAFATDTKSLHVLSGTAGTTTEFLPSTKVATKTELGSYATKASLKAVATSGSYNDLTDKPAVPTVDSALSSTSENPVQNKVINSALNGKLSTSGGTFDSGAALSNSEGTFHLDVGSSQGLIMSAGNSYAEGARLTLRAQTFSTDPGAFALVTNNGTTSTSLIGRSNGSLTWGGKPVLCGESGGFPVGFIALYSGNNVPNGWFRCDGSTIADMATNYPKLYAVLGTNVLPNSSGMCLQGAVSGIGTNVSAGLPNIKAQWSTTGYSRSEMLASGAVTHNYTARKSSDGQNSVAGVLSLDASRSSPIYGKSTTVQPPAVKVAVLIKHD